MSDKSTHITSLRRYVSLLRQEEKRLKWKATSTRVANVENIAAAADLRAISEKLISAERELFDLTLGPKR
jgi:hypothetical protein